MGNSQAKKAEAARQRLAEEEARRREQEEQERIRREREEADRRWRENAERVKQRICFAVQAHARGYCQRRRYKRERDMNNRRAMIAKEMLASEQSYVKYLEIVIEQFMRPLQASLHTLHPLVTFEQIRAIFSDVETIYGYNRNLLDEIGVRVGKWSLHQRIGDVFLGVVNYLKVYIQYVSNYTSSITVQETLKTQEHYMEWIQERESREWMEGKQLPSLLIMPIQRIPRYVMLLEDMLKNTDQRHRDYDTIAEATRKIKEVATLVNERKRETETFQTKLALCERLIPSGQEDLLMAPHVVLLREGEIKLEGTPYVFALLNSMLWRCKEKGTKLKLKGMYDITQLRVHDVADDKTVKLKNSFIIEHLGTKERLVLSTKTDEAKREWIQDIEEAYERETQKQKSRIDGARTIIIDAPSTPSPQGKMKGREVATPSPHSTTKVTRFGVPETSPASSSSSPSSYSTPRSSPGPSASVSTLPSRTNGTPSPRPSILPSPSHSTISPNTRTAALSSSSPVPRPSPSSPSSPSSVFNSSGPHSPAGKPPLNRSKSTLTASPSGTAHKAGTFRKPPPPPAAASSSAVPPVDDDFERQAQQIEKRKQDLHKRELYKTTPSKTASTIVQPSSPSDGASKAPPLPPRAGAPQKANTTYLTHR